MDITTLLVGLAILVGLAGIVVPVLPGSILIGLAIGVWAFLSATASSWWVFAGAVLLLGAGAVGTYFLTAKRTRAAGVPTLSLTVAGLAGIVGFFVVPVLGLPLFFVGGLIIMEYLRQRDLTAALSSAWVAIKAVGLGMLLELSLALAAASLWLVAAIWWV